MPWVNPATGELAPVPRGIDPGFAYNPGQQRDAAFFDAALAKAARAHPGGGRHRGGPGADRPCLEW
jgi:hypothetical protein